jgi:hypothetical protein
VDHTCYSDLSHMPLDLLLQAAQMEFVTLQRSPSTAPETV